MFNFFKKKSEPTPSEEKIDSILILGGTGRVGSQVIREALKRGYKVRAVTRDLSKTHEFKEGPVEWQQCDSTNKECMRKAVEGQHAIISSIYPENREPTKLFSDSFRVIIDVMKEKKVNRLMLVTCDWDSPVNSWFFKNIHRRMYRNARSDMLRMENMMEMRPWDQIRWTIVKTFKIVEHEYTGKSRAGNANLSPQFEPKTYTGDLSYFILDEMKQKNWANKFVTFGL